MAAAKAKKLQNRSLIHDAFPDQGVPNAAHLGSQSMSPPQGGAQDYIGNDPTYPNIGVPP